MLPSEHMPTPNPLPASGLSSGSVRTALYGVVAIGGSAGGIQALITLLSALPAEFPLPILVVQHLPPNPLLPSMLPDILGKRTALSVKWAQDGEAMVPGTVYVAPPDRHLLVAPLRRLALSSAARIGRWRPAVDALFQSAAEVFGEGAIAIVLSGMLWDGAKGISAVGRCGGITIAQDERTSGYFEMPSAALDLGRADLVMSPRRIAQALEILAALTSV